MAQQVYQRGDAEAAARAAWEWAREDTPGASREHRHGAAALGQLALAITVAAVLGLVVSPRWAILPLSAGVAFAAITWLSPDRLYPRILTAWRWIGRATGGLMTWLLLTPFYYLALTPFGLLRRRGRRDPLTRRRVPGATTYWVERREEPAAPEHYERQF